MGNDDPGMNDSTPQERKPNLKDYSRDSLRARFGREGWPAYRADQVQVWLYEQGVNDPLEMTNLPLDLREKLAGDWDTRSLSTRSIQTSSDGTRKFAFETSDEEMIEAVLIPEARRNTLCVSTQIGCPLACSFCATGAMGLTRNLGAGEIVDQFLRARAEIPEGESITNIVFMGMGEPLLNLPAVEESIRILIEPRTLGLAPRRVTVSTSGVIPRIRPLLEIAPINLAVSLHATTNEVRDVLVPLNKRFPLEELFDALRTEPLISRKRPVFFEYTLMEGVNDSLEDARRLPDLLRGIPCKLNVIPMNPHRDAPYRPSPTDVCDAFAAELHAGGLRVTLRRNRGRDIDAACGQLAARSAEITAPHGADSDA